MVMTVRQARITVLDPEDTSPLMGVGPDSRVQLPSFSYILISARANDSCEANEIVAPYNSGLMIEGLSILYSITQNATVENL